MPRKQTFGRAHKINQNNIAYIHFLKCPQQWNIEVLRSHSDKMSVVYLWICDQLDAETSKWQHATLIRKKYLCTRRDLNSKSQQALDCAATRLPYREEKRNYRFTQNAEFRVYETCRFKCNQGISPRWLRRSRENLLLAVQHTFRISQMVSKITQSQSACLGANVRINQTVPSIHSTRSQHQSFKDIPFKMENLLSSFSVNSVKYTKSISFRAISLVSLCLKLKVEQTPP
jgi:hypothetical protein